jgi:hypothetical protein
MKFKVGDRAYKPVGYQYPCTIVSVFTNTSGNIRVVGEMDFTKMLHIFNEEQLDIMNPEIEEEVHTKFRHFFSSDNNLTTLL